MSSGAWFAMSSRWLCTLIVVVSLVLAADAARAIPAGTLARSQGLISRIMKTEVPRDRQGADVLLDELHLIGDATDFDQFRTFLHWSDVDSFLGVETPTMTVGEAVAKAKGGASAYQASRDALFKKVVTLDLTATTSESVDEPLDHKFEVTPGLWAAPLPDDDQYPVEYYVAAQYRNNLAVPVLLKSRVYRGRLIATTVVLECPPTEVAPGAKATVICHATEPGARIRGDEATYAGMLDLKRHGADGAIVERSIQGGTPTRVVVDTPEKFVYTAYEPTPETRSAALSALKELGCIPDRGSCRPSQAEKLRSPAMGLLLVYALLAVGVLYLRHRSLVAGAPRPWSKAIFAMYMVVASATVAFATVHPTTVPGPPPYWGFLTFTAEDLLGWPWTQAFVLPGGDELFSADGTYILLPFLLVNAAILGAIAFMPARSRRGARPPYQSVGR
jgi:hypothetical protein